jgi:hypothetical protein
MGLISHFWREAGRRPGRGGGKAELALFRTDCCGALALQIPNRSR